MALETSTKYSNLTKEGFVVFSLDGINTRFEVWKDVSTFLDYFKTLAEPSRCYYETITENDIQKPRFDIDIPDDHWDVNTIVNDLLMSILKTFAKLGHTLDYRDVQIFTSNGYSNGKYKWSYHIVIDHYYHTTNAQAMVLYKSVLEGVRPDFRCYIDNAVYKSLQQFRLVGNTKRGENRIKLRLYEWNYNGSPLTWEKLNPEEEFIKSLLVVKGDVSTYKKLEIESNIIKSKSDKVDVELSFIESLVPDGFELGEEGEHGFRLNRVDSSYCEVCKRIHDSENAYIKISKGLVVYKCYRNLEGYFILGNIKPNIPEKPINKRQLASQSVKYDIKPKATQPINISYETLYNYENSLL